MFTKVLFLLLFISGVIEMKIREIVKEKQPKEFNKMNKLRNKKFNENELKDLMSHSSYKRKNGALRQIK